MSKAKLPISARLNERREKLGISHAVLAKRVGVSLRSVQRILSGQERNPGFATLASIARELGIGIRFDDEVDARTIRRRQAERKARRLVAITQGSSALEAQGLAAQTLRDLREETTNQLLAGSNRKLWAE
jgi:transcriptional regulator with XRE-family HTH domain